MTIALATKTEENVPTRTPTIKANAKSCMTEPPRKYRHKSTMKTVELVKIVLDRV
jgi:hypothetical protein